jgi:biopolymer transport protein ExbD
MRLVPVRGRRQPEVQIAPLIDVIFLLLIFYAVTTQFVTDERLKLELPEAKTAETVGQGRDETPPEVKVAADGSVWIDDEEVPEEQLEGRLRAMVERDPDEAIILRGDRGADYGVVVHVLDVARSVGATAIQMSAVKPPAETNQ